MDFAAHTDNLVLRSDNVEIAETGFERTGGRSSWARMSVGELAGALPYKSVFDPLDLEIIDRPGVGSALGRQSHRQKKRAPQRVLYKTVQLSMRLAR